MSVTVAINASPKADGGASGMLINQLEAILGTEIPTYCATRLLAQGDRAVLVEVLDEMLAANTLLVVFPLYVDALPAALVWLLQQLEQLALMHRSSAADRSLVASAAADQSLTEPALTSTHLPQVFAVCNCGFYEAEQTRFALEIIENFCVRASLTWRYGIGIGCGGFLQSQSSGFSKGPTAVVFSTLKELAEATRHDMSTANDEQNTFVTPQIPRLLYQMGGNLGWRKMAREQKNKTSLMARPHA